MPYYNLQQQAFTVSVLSNGVGGVQNEDQQALEVLLAKDIDTRFGSHLFTEYIGNWKTIWGPAVYVNDNDNVADNAMFAAQNQATKDIVVGIAGTNPVSKFDVSIEDLDVGETIQFPNAPNGAWIAQGTWDGVGILENMTDPTSGQKLVDFLNGLQPTGANLIFAGHSLGGALTPVFALDLVVNQGLTTSNFSNVYTYPTAGPTPGNQMFADFYGTKFVKSQGSGWQVWNQNVWNTIDVVPHAWNALSELPSLYPPLGTVTCVQKILNDKIIPALNGITTYAPINNSSFEGSYNLTVAQPWSSSVCAYVAQMAYQHIEAYFVEIIPDLASQFTSPSFSNSDCIKLRLYCSL